MKYILFNPGPVNVSERVRQALMKPDICHREDDFSTLLERVRGKITSLFTGNDDAYTTVMFSGSGTAALEAAVSNSVDDTHSLLIINNGVYGQRMVDVARICKIPYRELKCGWTEKPSPEEAEQMVRSDNRIAAVAMVHHETTTGLLNPLREMGRIANRYHKRFIVDSISGLGGEEINFRECTISLLISTANKCIHGLPGVSFVIAEREYLAEMRDFPPRNLYLNILKSYTAQEKGETPFTPAVQIFYALDEALNELAEEGIGNRIKHYRELSECIRQSITELGIRPFIPLKDMSNSISSFYVPAGKTYAAMHDYLKSKGYIIYAGQGDLQGKIFRIANMGNITIDDVTGFITHLKTWLTSE